MTEPRNNAGRLVEFDLLDSDRMALATCDVCGAAVVVLLGGDPAAAWWRHSDWHRQLMADLLPRVKG